ncbi:LLM class flavin-dependent oxidoreductase [Streptomyces roseirectus]|uniref:LLM class flavin-dependent oxidoreductase n=1 Tax=Streptomyces roseirectus TaxID=2768066 RepID=A0A7H0ICC5_9ACTN|nr:LLM class flavin-dependent oxidoreductase [Streptomyces roseirectus]QNP70441.1 LLM class flavin-dependent oxidoreductase [Streptomyces roseirectus]
MNDRTPDDRPAEPGSAVERLAVPGQHAEDEVEIPRHIQAPAPRPGLRPAHRRRPAPDFSLSFSGGHHQDPGYGLLVEAARYADTHGFHGLWLPERHLHSSGGLFPNPLVLAAALARETHRVRINTVVLPPHDPVRIAGEWSMADSLSGGRIGIGIGVDGACGERLEQIRALWRGGRRAGDVSRVPRPVQPDPPVFLAVGDDRAGYEEAARAGLGVVTEMTDQSVERFAEDVAHYRATRERYGFDPDAGRVVVVLSACPGTGLALIDALAEAGADELAALVDLGVTPEQLRAVLGELDVLRRRYHEDVPQRTTQRAPQRAAPAQYTEHSAPATPVQRRLWLAARRLGAAAHNEARAVRLRGPLDLTALRTAVEAVVHRHDGLRTVFRAEEGDADGETLRQVVLPPAPVGVTVTDARGQDPSDTVQVDPSDIIRAVREDAHDLAHGPLFTVTVVRLGDDDHLLVLGTHRIALDGHAVRLVTRDLGEAYRAVREGRVPEFSGPAGTNLSLTVTAGRDGDVAWWREHLGEVPPVLRLPTDRPRGGQFRGPGAAVTVRLDAADTARLQSWSGRHRVTLFATLCTGWQAVLRGVCGQDEFLLATTFGQREPQAQDVVGSLAAVLPLRVSLTDATPLDEAVRATRDALLDAGERAAAPLDALLAGLTPHPGEPRSLTPVSVDFGDEPLLGLTLPGLRTEAVEDTGACVPLELMLTATRSRTGLALRLQYDTGLYDEATARGLVEVLVRVLTAVADEWAETVGDLPVSAEGPAPASASTAAELAANPDLTPVTLFCLPPVGGSPLVFRPLLAALPLEIDAVVVGRGKGAGRSFEESVGDVAGWIAERVGEGAYALFGHGGGGLPAYEVARRLVRDGGPGPRHLFVAESRPPQRDAGESEPRLACPVTVVTGGEEVAVSVRDVDLWAELTTGPVSQVELEGDVMESHADAVAERVRGALFDVPEAEPVTPELFREAMARLAAPVTVVTAWDGEGRARAFTASAVCSLSAEPPLLLVCVDRSSRAHEVFTRADRFLVNVLGDEQAAVAREFAGRDRAAAEASLVPLERGLPGLPGAAARFACVSRQVLPGGDHSILTGRIEAVALSDAPALVHFRRGWHRAVALPPEEQP